MSKKKYKKIYSNASYALEDVLFDGMTIMSGGFGLCGLPENLIVAIKKSGVSNLKVISNNENKLVLSYEKSKLSIDPIITEIKKQDIKIQDISTDDGDLEDVFLRLTKN